MYRVQLLQHDQIGSTLKRLNGSVCCHRWTLAFAAVRAKLSRQFAEGGRMRPLCEIAAVQMKSGKVLVEAFKELLAIKGQAVDKAKDRSFKR